MGENSKLPIFLYEDAGEIKIGYHGDTVVTDEWNEYIKRIKEIEYQRGIADGKIIQEHGTTMYFE